MEIEDLGGEENLELGEAVRKSGAHRKNILHRIVYGIFSNFKGEKKNINHEVVLLMSDIVNSMSTEDKLLLTLGIGDDAIPPQQTFIDFFKLYDVRHVSPTKFKYKFVELYHKKGREFLDEVIQAEDKNVDVINAFGKNFIILIEPEVISARFDHNKPLLRIKLFFVSLAQKARRLRRIFLGGIGGDD